MLLSKRALLTTVIVISGFEGTLLSSPVTFAQTSSVPQAATSQAQQAPEEKFIQDLGDKAIAIAANRSLSTTEVDTKYDELLKTAFDMQTISKFVLGRAWARATPEQQQDYFKLFQQLVLKTYGSRMHFYNGETFHVTGIHQQSDQDSTVASTISHPDGSPSTPIDWLVRHEQNGQYAIIDVIVDGVSQSVTQRDEFSSILGNNNGSIDALINVLRQKIQQPTPVPGAK